MASPTESDVHRGPGIRLVLAKFAVGISALLFFAGYLVLCYCPGWYATAAVFAGIGAVLGTGRTRFWSTLMLLASLTWTVMHSELELADKERWRERRRRAEPGAAADRGNGVGLPGR
jgi:hypothetical protein